MMRLFTCLFLLLIFCNCLFAQDRIISGTVVAKDDGLVLPGVSVKVAGTSKGTLTDNKGRYSLKISAAEVKLIFTYIGYVSKEIDAVANYSIFNVELESDQAQLREVVVTGYTSESKSKYTGSVGMVSGSKIDQVPIGSFDQILQGRVAGLYATAGSGQPGAAARITIRGIGSIAGQTQPLFVVDGTPVETSIYYGINPSDIESVYVLKDATSTALYGSRGSNGVVIVTTKRGKEGNFTVGYNMQTGFSKVTTSNFNMLNSAQRIQLEEEVGLEDTLDIGPGWSLSGKNPKNANLSLAQKAKNAQILDSLKNTNVDWRDIFLRNGKFSEHEINIQGGNQKIRFYASGNYYNQEGIALRSFLERYSFRNNLDFKSNKLSGSFNVGLSVAKTSGIEGENSSAVSNSFASVYYALPYEQPYINGKLYTSGNKLTAPYTIYDRREGSDALERLLDASSKSDLIKSLASGNVRYEFTDFLAFTSNFGLDFRETNFIRTITPGTYFGDQAPGGQGSHLESLTRNLQFITTSGLHIKKSYSKHDFGISALFEIIRNRYKNFSFTGYGINPKLTDTPAGITPGSVSGFIPTLGGSKTQNAIVSFIGTSNYSYDNKYIANFNYRYDGASVLPENNRWKGFYSFGLGWNVKNEEFLKDINQVNDLKLRASYGLTASPFPGNFNYISTYETSKYGSSGIIATSAGNSDYNWEYSKQLDLGIDISLFRNRVTASFDWYNRRTENLFILQTFSSTAGFPSSTINSGKMRNRGIEGDISLNIISSKNWSASVGGNFNYNKNVIQDLGQVTEYVTGTTIVREGLPFGSHYLPEWAGVDPTNGKAQYYKRDGTISNDYDLTSQGVAKFGTYQPPFQGGFFGNIKFRQLYADAFFSYADGYYRLNNEDYFNENSSFATSNQSTLVLSRWRQKGDVTNVQRFKATIPRKISSKDIQDASYIRFRNLKIGYSLSKNLLSKLKVIQKASVFVQGQNLYTWTKWTGFDPEDNNSTAFFEYPTPRSYTLGLNVNF